MPGVAKPREITRCAIYTRKSTEAPSGQEMTSLAGQRTVCSAYIKCQAHKGWVELEQAYDDEGYSGGNLERPALHRLLADARAGRVDVIVFYKIDRLTRSLADFVRLMDAFQHVDIAFVSVTQSFDTSDSMGRMILNILLTFAQFEREMMGDRIRDKKATLKRSGLYIGRIPPIGYRLEKGHLLIDESEAAIVREAFARFDEFPSRRSLLRALEEEGKGKLLSKSRHGRQRAPLHDSSAHRIFSNPVYAGLQWIDGELVEGSHEPLITRDRWDEVQAKIAALPVRSRAVDLSVHLLAGLVKDDAGRVLAPRCRGTRAWPQRYYESDSRRLRVGARDDKVRVRSSDLEVLVRSMLAGLLNDPRALRSAALDTAAGKSLRGMDRSAAAAARLVNAEAVELRAIFEAVIGLVEVAKGEVRVWVRTQNLLAYVNWAGVGLFRCLSTGAPDLRELHLIRASANLVSSRLKFQLAYERAPGPAPRAGLRRLLQRAAEADRRLLADPSHDLEAAAAESKLSPSRFSRLLRLNYLAPDIRSAILDGRQPEDLTERKLLYSPLPTDWHQQRAMLGFPEPAKDVPYRQSRAMRPPLP